MSELLAIVTLIGIVIAVAAFIATWIGGMVTSQTVKHELSVEYARLLYTPGANAWYLTVTVKNTGTAQIREVRVNTLGSFKVYDNTLGGWAWRTEGRVAGTLNPGHTASHTWQVNSATVGRAYILIFKVWWTDGSYKEYSVSVLAEHG